MISERILKNKSLPMGAERIVERLGEEGKEVLFVIVGDLAKDGKYSGSALIFTKDTVTVYDEHAEEEEKCYCFSDLTYVRSKRMYGNATLSAQMPSGKREIFFRYTYAVASLCDAAALFINNVKSGGNLNEETAQNAAERFFTPERNA